MTTLAKYYEGRPLKLTSRQNKKLGPPDRYPQEKEQAEDKLTTYYLKHGFDIKNQLLVTTQQEVTSAKDIFCNLRKLEDNGENNFMDKIVNSLNKIHRESLEIKEISKNDYLQKRKVSIPQECFKSFPIVHQKIRNDFKVFLEDLASPMLYEDMLNPKKRNCKIPVCQAKKGEMYFYLLAEFNVPISRAAWYLKLVANISPTLVQDQAPRSKNRSRTNDIFSEWTKYLVSFLDDIWSYLIDPNSPRLKNNLSVNSPLVICTIPNTKEMVEEYWTYANDIMNYMFSENMLDKEDIISWILKVGEKLRPGDEFQLRQLLPIFMFYLNDIVRGNLNSRRLAYIVTHMLHWIRVDIPEETIKIKKEEEDVKETTVTTNSTTHVGEDPKWRTIIWGLNTIIQIITLYAPGALVWYEPVCPSIHPGSPLDLLPQAPSQMYVAPGGSEAFGGEQHFQNQLRVMEREISKRSLAVEVKWSWDKCRDPQTASVITNVLHILDILDNTELEYSAEKAQKDPSRTTADSLKFIYESIFINTSDSENEPIVGILCDWATTSYRAGKHRGVLVAKLLSMRQDVVEENNRKLVPYFQEYLFNYLQEAAPGVKERTKEFHNLIVLFGELIRHDIFSHTYYVSSLISRGEVTTPNNNGEDNRHYPFLKHIPIPYSIGHIFGTKSESDDSDEQNGERNQRAIALYGIGSNRREAKKKRRSLLTNLYRLFSEQCDETTNLYISDFVKQFRRAPYYDRWSVGYYLAKKFLIPLHKTKEYRNIQSQAEMKLPTRNGMSCLLDLILESGNILNALEFIQFLISSLQALEKFWKKTKNQDKDEIKMHIAIYNSHVQYIRQIGLIFTGVLKQMHKYLILEPELCYKMFLSLNKLLYSVEPAECFASERVMLIHINKIANGSKYVFEKVTTGHGADDWKAKSIKIKENCEKTIEAGTNNFRYNSLIYDDLCKLSFSDIAKIKRWCKKHLQSGIEKGEENRYSLASAITIQVCSPNTNNLRLNELGRLAAELTSMVPPIAQDWLGILQAIMPKDGNKGYNDVCTRIDGVSPITLAEQLAVLYGIMMTRGALQMKSVVNIVLTSVQHNAQVAKRSTSDPKLSQKTRDNVRLCCAFLLIILRSNPPKDFLTETTDRHLLKDVQCQLNCGYLLNILKTLMFVSSDVLKTKISSGHYLSLSIHVDLYSLRESSQFLKNAPKDVAEMSFQILKIICSETWVKENCLKDEDKYITNILDKHTLCLPGVESQLLIELISHPGGDHDEEIKKYKLEDYIQGILHNLKIWTLRQSLLKLLHLFNSTDKRVEICEQLATNPVARLITDIFQSTPVNKIKMIKNFPGLKREISSVWLLAPLVSKLPDYLHTGIHNNCTLLLDMGSKIGNEKLRDSDIKGRQHQPFINLILACIERQPLERKNLMDKLIEQIQQFIDEYKDKTQILNSASMNCLIENLQLRLSLLGGMFNTVLQHGPIAVSNLLIQLISTRIANLERFTELHHTCIDMLGFIIHSLSGGDSAIHEIIGMPAGLSKKEPNKSNKKKIEQKIVKKLGDIEKGQYETQLMPIQNETDKCGVVIRDKVQYETLRQLIPIQKETDQRFEVIRFEKIHYNESRKWRTGLKPSGKEKINPWFLVEGLRDKPICLSWFGASRAEKEPEEWQYRERIDQYPEKRKFEEWLHLHDLPSEDEEPPPEKKPAGDSMISTNQPANMPFNNQNNIRQYPNNPLNQPGGLYPLNNTMPSQMGTQNRIPMIPINPSTSINWQHYPKQMGSYDVSVVSNAKTAITSMITKRQQHIRNQIGPNGNFGNAFPPQSSYHPPMQIRQINPNGGRMPNYPNNPMPNRMYHPNNGMHPMYPNPIRSQGMIHMNPTMNNNPLMRSQYPMRPTMSNIGMGQNNIMRSRPMGHQMGYQNQGHMQQQHQIMQQHQAIQMRQQHPMHNPQMNQPQMGYQMQRQNTFNQPMMQNPNMMQHGMQQRNQNQGMYPQNQPYS